MYIEPINLPKQNRHSFLEYQESELNEKRTRGHFNTSTPQINNLLQPTTVFLIEQVLQRKVIWKI